MHRLVALTAAVLVAGCNYHIDKQKAEIPMGRTLLYKELCDTVLAAKCFRCHGGGQAAGGVALDDPAELLATGLVVPGKPDQSPLYTVLVDDYMPPGPGKLSAQEKDAVRAWIADGAPVVPGDVAPPPEPPAPEPPVVRFAEVQEKVLSVSCVRCHRGANPAAGVLLETYEDLLGGDDPLVVPGDPKKSLLYEVVADDVMPPRTKLTADQKAILLAWISSGAKE